MSDAGGSPRSAGAGSLPVERAVLVILDGWGLAPAGPGNAVSLAATPVFDELWSRFPTTTLTASGGAVGLPDGQMGNSEVGHLNLGAGSVVMQDLTRIDAAARDGSFAENPVLREALSGGGREALSGGGREALSGGGRAHIIGLVSDGGVHSSMDHLRALIEMAGAQGVEELIVHAFTDGRDTSPHGGAEYLRTVEAWMSDAGVGRIGTVIGRYYAMDRDRRWDRVQKAYDLLVHGRGEHTASSGAAACAEAYERGETDEFIAATVVGERDSRIQDGDSVIGLNFRPDRMREITLALCSAQFDDVDRGGATLVARYATMAEYDENWSFPVAFAPQRPATTIGSVIAAAGGRQLHVAETEKYPHVTYFFNGGEEVPYDGEERALVDSPRDVPTYDHKPEMSAAQAARAFVEAWTGAAGDGPGFRFGIINFANADMVGHTGVIPAAVTAVETVDRCLGEIVDAVMQTGGALLITADHGNADHMLNDDGSPNTAHSLNPVPVIVTAEGVALRDGGVLADVAPTLLEMLGSEPPPEMTGRSLIA